MLCVCETLLSFKPTFHAEKCICAVTMREKTMYLPIYHMNMRIIHLDINSFLDMTNRYIGDHLIFDTQLT